MQLFCVNDHERFCIDLNGENLMAGLYGFSPTSEACLQPTEGMYLYEPNASVMKAGCFAAIEQRFGVSQVAQNSHLFLSKTLISDFPGRKFRIMAQSTMNKGELKRVIAPLRQANITVRNFPLSVVELRKRLKLTEGGSHYLFATTLAHGERVLLVCHQLSHQS